MIAFLTSKLGLAGIALTLVLGAFAFLRVDLGIKEHRIAALEAAQVAAKADAAKHEAAAATISAASLAAVATDRVRVQTVTRTLIEKVPQYVPEDADRDCVVPRGWVRLHDAAAAGLSSPPGGPDEAASGVPLSAVAATVVANYGVAYDWRAEVLGWRSWYADQKAAWDKK